MYLLITGANGFLGRHVVQAAVVHGHRVRAMVRPTADVTARWGGDNAANLKGVEIVRHDLRDRRELVERVRGVDAVLHLAAAKTGDYYTQMAGTVVATENLLASMHEARVDRLVLTSSFAVYDYLAVASAGTLDEDSLLEREPERRDAYCRSKLWQERLVREAMTRQDVKATVLRPGVVYAEPDHLWTDRLGVRVGRTWFAIGAHARLPLTHVCHCAEAIVRAAERPAAIGQTLNLVDDDSPTQRRYRRALRKTMRPRIVPINWTLTRLGVWLLDAVDRRVLAGRAQLPAVLRRRALHARCRPLHYPNQRAKEVLGWSAPARWRNAIKTAATDRAGRAAAALLDDHAFTQAGEADSHLPKSHWSSTDTSCVSHT